MYRNIPTTTSDRTSPFYVATERDLALEVDAEMVLAEEAHEAYEASLEATPEEVADAERAMLAELDAMGPNDWPTMLADGLYLDEVEA